MQVKIGHGGTLDPLATGILVTGVGRGTKYLNSFLESTKTYETVILFGAETDTYDCLGKVVRRAPYEHITRDAVEAALGAFRGKILQRPPIFSALRVQGKRLYEYAREGIEPPVDIKAREVDVHDLRILEWYPPGKHEYRWPETELAGDEKAVAVKLLDKDAAVPLASSEADADASNASVPPADVDIDAAADASKKGKKRKTPPPAAEDSSAAASEQKKTKTDSTSADAQGSSSPTVQPESSDPQKADQSQPDPSPPAVKISMTVSSGFYVRSFAHDLGKAVGSCGLMSSLVRSRQWNYVLEPDKVLEYQDLEKGEEVWGPKVRRFLEEWQRKHPVDKNR